MSANQRRDKGKRPVVCHICNTEGHIAPVCPNRRQASVHRAGSDGGGERGCRKCGQEGHFARECPNQRQAGGQRTGLTEGGSGCYKCGEQGHLARDCTNPRQAPSRGGVVCHKCNEPGHIAPHCPNNRQALQGGPRQSSSGVSGRGCHNCGQEGHIARDCPMPRQVGYGGPRTGSSRGSSSIGGPERDSASSSGPSRGGPESTAPLDVISIAKEVEILPEFKGIPKGKEGTAVELITNHFPIRECKDLLVYQYDIDINLRRRDGKGLVEKREGKSVRNDKQTENKQIVDQMLRNWPEVAERAQPNSYAYDGHKILFTLENIGIGTDPNDEAVTREVIITLDGFPEQTYELKVQFSRDVPLSDSTVTHDFEAARQLMDIVLRDRMQRALVGVGRNLYERDATNTKRLNYQNCEIGFGHHQSIQKTQTGLTLNVDRVTTTFRTRNVDETLLDFMQRELSNEFRNFRDLKSFKFDGRVIDYLSYKLKDLKIYTMHIKINGVGQKRKTGIESMAKRKDGRPIRPIDHSFETEPKTETKPATRVTLDKYYKDRYGITLQFPDIPLIQIKGGTKQNPKYYPAEICHVYANQQMPFHMITPDIQQEIVKSTNTQTPPERFQKIQTSVETIPAVSQELMGNYGLEIKPEPIKLKGREVAQPKIIGNERKLNKTVELKRSKFLNLSPNVARNLQGNFDNFFAKPQYGLIDCAKSMGFKVAKPELVTKHYDLFSPAKQMDSFASFIEMVSEEKEPPQLIFVCIPTGQALYDWIKHLSENIFGIMTQCIKDIKFMNLKSGYFNKFLLKTNAKLNGQNFALAPGQVKYRPKVLTDLDSTMVIGADVTHSGYHNPLANERVICSIAAMVGSYDQDFTKFMPSVSAQRPESVREYILGFGAMFEDLIVKLKKPFPKNIVIFRDGVSESQFDAVLKGEVPQIEAVYRRRNLAIPKIIVYVVQKRHHTRIFLTKPTVERNGKVNFNMKSGTVVDHTITNPDHNEFHLCSHNGPLGTSRHAKYVVLRNDHNFSEDQLQLMAYSMCFTFCRCPTPISHPIPVRYADLAAYRAKQHLAAQNDPAAPLHTQYKAAPRGNRKETNEEKIVREMWNTRIINESIPIMESLRPLPYYC